MPFIEESQSKKLTLLKIISAEALPAALASSCQAPRSHSQVPWQVLLTISHKRYNSILHLRVKSWKAHLKGSSAINAGYGKDNGGLPVLFFFPFPYDKLD